MKIKEIEWVKKPFGKLRGEEYPYWSFTITPCYEWFYLKVKIGDDGIYNKDLEFKSLEEAKIRAQEILEDFIKHFLVEEK